MFKNCIQTIQLGNEYRKNKYGPEETFAESYARARRHVAWERENLKPKTKFYWPWTEASAQWCKDQDSFKSHFAFWDEWTGGRYERVENPDQSKVKDRFSVCRSNPVTGEWEAL
jgi:hypothetical protein